MFRDIGIDGVELELTLEKAFWQRRRLASGAGHEAGRCDDLQTYFLFMLVRHSAEAHN